MLGAIGLVGGATAVLGALQAIELAVPHDPAPFVPPEPSDFALQGRSNETTVLVLGAGVAGLAAAYELEKAGYAVTVLDARDRVGGRNLTVRGGTSVTDTRGRTQTSTFLDDRWFNAGPARLAQHHVTLRYCRELGVPVEVFVNSNPDAFVAVRGDVRRRRAAQADLDGYVSELLVKAVTSDVLDGELSSGERSGLVDHLRTIGVVQRGYEGEPDDLSVLLGLGLGTLTAFDREHHQAMPMFHPVGGMDAVPRALADAIRGDIRLGVEIVEARRATDGVRVVTATGEELVADVGICTLPPHLAANLDHDWGDDVGRALAEAQPITTGKIGLEYDRRWWETDFGIHGGPTSTDRDPREIWYPSTGYLGDGGGVLTGAYPFGPAAQRFSGNKPAARLEDALKAGVQIHGDVYRDELRSSFSVDWRTQRFSEGAWAVFARFGAEWERLQDGARPWWFAGDWLSRDVGWQHGALESARAAVTAVHTAVLASG